MFVTCVFFCVFLQFNSLMSQMQTPIVKFVFTTLHGKWVYPNVVLMFIPLFGTFFVIASYRFEKQKKMAAAEEETSNLILAMDEPAEGSSSGTEDENDEDEISSVISSSKLDK